MVQFDHIYASYQQLMKNEHEILINLIQKYLENNPEQRFGQVLFNLRINEFKKNNNPETNQLRDIYNDSDSEIIDRIHSQLDWFELQRNVDSKVSKINNLEGLTVNERLHLTGLSEDFEKLKEDNPIQAKFILERLKVDSDSIDNILNIKS